MNHTNCAICYFISKIRPKKRKSNKILNGIPKFKGHDLLKEDNKNNSKKEKELKPDSAKIRRTSIPYLFANEGWVRRDIESNAQALDYLMVENSSSGSWIYPPRSRRASHWSESSSHLNESDFSDQSQPSDELWSSTPSLNESLDDYQENFSDLEQEDQINFLFLISQNQFPWEKKIDDYEFNGLMINFEPLY
jgi:hypothetical protein